MLEIIIAVFGLLLSFFFSGAEMALLSSSRIQLEVWQKKKIKGSAAALEALNDSEKYISTNLIGINIANILTTSFATIALLRIIESEWIVFIIVSFSILILAEILPKTIFREAPNFAMLFFGRSMVVFELLFYPAIKFLEFYRRIILKSNVSSTSSDHTLDRNELHFLLNQSNEESDIGKHERETIAKIFQFRHTVVNEILTPRPDIKAIAIDASIEEAESKFLEFGFSKMPVYDQTIDDIKGVIFLHDLFKQPKNIQEILRPTYFVPETKSAVKLLSEFKEQHISLAIIVDEYGGTDGIVTMEDLSEEVFGEFSDAFDMDSTLVQEIESGWLVQGLAEVDELNHELGLDIPPGDYETLAGFIIASLGHIPIKDEHVKTHGFRFDVSAVTATRVERIFIQPLN
jgi:putative hemolysin